MAHRITEKDLKDIILEINNISVNKITLYGAYGGWKILHSKGNNDFLYTGFISKPALYTILKAYKAGIRESQS